jgi:DNA-binding NtrC family response regulator
MPEREGLVGRAADGTLFLDEIGELTDDLQAHLLRWMDSGGEYQRLGEASSRTSRARLVAATNRAPESLKHDVLARFGSRISLPGFDVRREDLPLLLRERTIAISRKSPELASRFVYTGPDGAEHVRVGARLLRAVLLEPLPGNARELETLVWKAIEESPADELELAGSAPGRGRPARTPSATNAESLSREDVVRTLEANRKSVTRAARALGLSSRFALYRLMDKYEIPR